MNQIITTNCKDEYTDDELVPAYNATLSRALANRILDDVHARTIRTGNRMRKFTHDTAWPMSVRAQTKYNTKLSAVLNREGLQIQSHAKIKKGQFGFISNHVKGGGGLTGEPDRTITSELMACSKGKHQQVWTDVASTVQISSHALFRLVQRVGYRSFDQLKPELCHLTYISQLLGPSLRHALEGEVSQHRNLTGIEAVIATGNALWIGAYRMLGNNSITLEGIDVPVFDVATVLAPRQAPERFKEARSVVLDIMAHERGDGRRRAAEQYWADNMADMHDNAKGLRLLAKSLESKDT